MPDPQWSADTAELARIFQRLIRLKHRLRVVLPEDLEPLRAWLHGLRPEDAPTDDEDYELIYRIGVILSSGQATITMGDLSRALDVSLSSATRVVDWLAAHRYAERQPDPDDRRVVRVALTETGLRTYRALHTFVRGRIERLLSCFTPEERLSLAALMTKLADGLERELQSAAGPGELRAGDGAGAEARQGVRGCDD